MHKNDLFYCDCVEKGLSALILVCGMRLYIYTFRVINRILKTQFILINESSKAKIQLLEVTRKNSIKNSISIVDEAVKTYRKIATHLNTKSNGSQGIILGHLQSMSFCRRHLGV